TSRCEAKKVTHWTVGWATLGSPSPRPSPLGRGRMVHRFSITPVPEFAQRPSAKHPSDACGSLSLRERVTCLPRRLRRRQGVRGKYSVEHAKCRISQRLLSKRLIPPAKRFWLSFRPPTPARRYVAAGKS